eukprot:TRINITY_DN2938_c1_g1_i1.p1 TRINITY_DN2938_c1_g1~~TRINITY_DN2938_c1_g1_i1.p1  ORF type:complete len:454 (+),score=79.49 TRINITY_DN2938_c1_g1_i1:100-1461(+)
MLIFVRIDSSSDQPLPVEIAEEWTTDTLKLYLQKMTHYEVAAQTLYLDGEQLEDGPLSDTGLEEESLLLLVTKVYKIQLSAGYKTFCAQYGTKMVCWGEYNIVESNVKKVVISERTVTVLSNTNDLVIHNKGPLSMDGSCLSHIEKIFGLNTATLAIGNGGMMIFPSDVALLPVIEIKESIKSITTISGSCPAAAVLLDNNNVITCGSPMFGGNPSPKVAKLLKSNTIKEVSSTGSAFAALTYQGDIFSWGMAGLGGDLNADSLISENNLKFRSIQGTYAAFAAVSVCGNILTWGSEEYGSVCGTGGIIKKNEDTVFEKVFSTHGAFCALDRTGQITVWGQAQYGGSVPHEMKDDLHSIIDVAPSYGAFTALRSDGHAFVWGSSYYGGDSSSVASRLTSGITSVVGNKRGFAAVKQTGELLSWGMPGIDASCKKLQPAFSSMLDYEPGNTLCD